MIQTHPSRQRGNLAELDAIRYFTEQGFKVSVPVFPTEYDLLIDDGEEVYRIEVKALSTAYKGRRGTGWAAVVSKKAYQAGKITTVARETSVVDYIYGLAPDNTRFIIPGATIVGRHTIYFRPDQALDESVWFRPSRRPAEAAA